VSDFLGTGRHLSPVELRAWTGFLDSGRMLEHVLANHLAEEHQLSHREYEVLVRLDGNGGRMRMTTLAQQIVASGALVTQTIVRLEDRSLVQREPAQSGDGRGVEAVLLSKGREALAESAADHAAIIRTLLTDRIGGARLADFADAAQSVAEHLRAHRRGESCEDPDCPAARYG
jgi:DNA-binding MarR family transcriptional regulator